jgi:hypothetical protein
MPDRQRNLVRDATLHAAPAASMHLASILVALL